MWVSVGELLHPTGGDTADEPPCALKHLAGEVTGLSSPGLWSTVAPHVAVLPLSLCVAVVVPSTLNLTEGNNMTARADRDLQTIFSEDGKSFCMFDKSRAEEHRTERATAFDHGHIVAIWKTEFNNFVRCIEPADSDDFNWQQISAGTAHIYFSERGLHHLVSDSEFKKILV